MTGIHRVNALALEQPCEEFLCQITRGLFIRRITTNEREHRRVVTGRGTDQKKRKRNRSNDPPGK